MENTEFNLKPKQELLNDVKEFYEKEVLPFLPDYDKKRKKDFLSTFIILLFNVLFLGLFVYVKSVIFLIVSLILFLQLIMGISAYELNIKTDLMPKFLTMFGKFKWEHYFMGRLSYMVNRLRTLKIFPKTECVMLDDSICGTYKNVEVNIYEVKTGLYANSIIVLIINMLILVLPVVLVLLIILGFGVFFLVELNILSKNVGVILCFSFLAIALITGLFHTFKNNLQHSIKGVVIEYAFPKNFEQETIIYENKPSLEKIINKLFSKYEQIILEDESFNRKYLVFSNNQVESRYLLTTAFIERFKEINVAFDSVSQRAEFKGDKLYILIKTKKDLFNFGSLSKETSLENFEQSFEELYSIIKLSDHFKLDQKIGL